MLWLGGMFDVFSLLLLFRSAFWGSGEGFVSLFGTASSFSLGFSRLLAYMADLIGE